MTITKKKIREIIDKRLNEIMISIAGGNGFIRKRVNKKEKIRATLKTLEFMRRDYEQLKKELKL